MSTENTNIKQWYQATYPTDEFSDYISDKPSFEDLFNLLDNYGEFYSFMFTDGFVDSVIRERIFSKLAEIMDVPYVYIYEQWLKGK